MALIKIECRANGGRQVFIVDAHHHVLAAWANIRRNLTGAPHLISFDSHTDSHRAFMRYLQLPYDSPKLPALSKDLVRTVHFINSDSVFSAIEKLWHDEHIDCAIGANIIDRAFISLGAAMGVFHNPRISVFKDICLPGCTQIPHNDDCLRKLANHVLEPELVESRIETIVKELGTPLDRMSYILDIDLDVFRTRRAVSPANPAIFHNLIYHAEAITIARERRCVADLRLDDDLNADELELMVLKHIQCTRPRA